MKITLFKFWIIFIFDPYHFKMWILVSKVYRVLNFFLLSMLVNDATIKWQLHLKQHSINIQKQSNFRFFFPIFIYFLYVRKSISLIWFILSKLEKGSSISSEKTLHFKWHGEDHFQKNITPHRQIFEIVLNLIMTI